MKPFFVLLISFLSGQAFANGQYERMMNDPMLRAVIDGLQSKYEVKCFLPEATDISWRCLNGPQCGYSMTVSCPANGSATSPSGVKAEGMQVVIDGFDDGKQNNFSVMKFKHFQR
jgi:hypothetical protein